MLSNMIKWCLFAAAFASMAAISSKASTEIRINGQEPNAYYAKFIYGQKTIANSKNKFWSCLVNDSMIVLPQSARASLTLFLMQDGTFTLRYLEGQASGPGSFVSDSKKDQFDLQGRWRVNGDNLELEGVATATAIQVGTMDVNGKNILVDGIGFKLSKDIRASGLAGKPILMIPAISTQPM